jgi:2'-deoxynucleoside 5'-phosphate N-hydrolase
MNLYFACSVTGGREYEPVYQALIQALLADGHQIPTAHLADSGVVELELSVRASDVYARDTEWIAGADALIAEVSVPSHGVGYEIGYALQAGKRVLCLAHDQRRISKMITGNPDARLAFRTYGDNTDAIRLAREFIQSLH